MVYRKLFVFVEGPDDERFFKNVLKGAFSLRYDEIVIKEYSGLKKKGAELLGLFKKEGSDIIYQCDMDGIPCVSAKKGDLVTKYGGRLKEIDIIVVIKEVEGWYYAGVNQECASALGVGEVETTDSMTKEEFAELMPDKYITPTNFMIEILKNYSLESARRKNKSLKYFCDKWIMRYDDVLTTL